MISNFYADVFFSCGGMYTVIHFLVVKFMRGVFFLFFYARSCVLLFCFVFSERWRKHRRDLGK